MTRFVALFGWCYLVWIILTWTRTVEQLMFGAGLSALAAASVVRLGGVVRPWRLLAPRVVGHSLLLAVVVLGNIVRANLSLAWRVWHPRRPIRSGMVIVPTRLRSDGGLAGVGLLTSLVVDNQIVDVDRRRQELLYHAVVVPDGSADEAYREINGPFERHLAVLEHR